MERIYEVDSGKKAELTKILENEPYASDSFARAGYKIRDGATLGADKDKMYLYVNASEDFIKKADGQLKDVAKVLTGENAKKIADAIKNEEDNAAAGVGAIFGG